MVMLLADHDPAIALADPLAQNTISVVSKRTTAALTENDNAHAHTAPSRRDFMLFPPTLLSLTSWLLVPSLSGESYAF